jgi:hypothetical protein
MASIMVDEMCSMRMNFLRWKVVHNLLGNSWFLPVTLDEFEDKTRWTHILSVRL